MPRYDFKCHECDKVSRDVILPITHRDGDRPECCGEDMWYYITSPPQVLWKDPIIDPFRPVATPNAPVISSMREHREYMARNDLVDANDLYAPPTASEERVIQAEAQESIDAISPTAEQNQQLQESGLDSILE